jgi:hypothetical protein
MGIEHAGCSRLRSPGAVHTTAERVKRRNDRSSSYDCVVSEPKHGMR